MALNVEAIKDNFYKFKIENQKIQMSDVINDVIDSTKANRIKELGKFGDQIDVDEYLKFMYTFQKCQGYNDDAAIFFFMFDQEFEETLNENQFLQLLTFKGVQTNDLDVNDLYERLEIKRLGIQMYLMLYEQFFE